MNLERTVFPWPGDPRIHIKEDSSLDTHELIKSLCRNHFKVPGAGSSILNFLKVAYFGASRAFTYLSSISDSSDHKSLVELHTISHLARNLTFSVSGRAPSDDLRCVINQMLYP